MNITPEQLQRENAQLREALEAMVSSAKDKGCGLKIADEALTATSDDWLKRHDAEVLRKAATCLSYEPIAWNELRRMAAELEGESDE